MVFPNCCFPLLFLPLSHIFSCDNVPFQMFYKLSKNMFKCFFSGELQALQQQLDNRQGEMYRLENLLKETDEKLAAVSGENARLTQVNE